MQDMGVRNEYDDAPRAPRRSGGFLGKFIAVLLGLIIGILAGAGGLAGIIYVVIAKTKPKKRSQKSTPMPAGSRPARP